jgi:fluoroquinolone resistance protein
VRRELDREDRELLKDIFAFNVQYAATGWHIEDRAVTEDLSGVWLSNSTIVTAEFVFTKLRSSRLADTRFDGVEFHQADFSQAVMGNVVFANCRFVLCQMQAAVLKNCRFINCQSERLDATGTTFEDCTFEALEEGMGCFTKAVLKDCAFERCKLDGSAFHKTRIDEVAFRSSGLTDLVFDDIRGTGLSFEHPGFEGAAFVDSHYGAITFDGGVNRAVKFNRFDAESVVLKNIARTESLSIRDSVWKESSIANCPEVVEWTINLSQMENFTVTASQIAYLDLQKSEFSGSSRIANCVIAGLNASGARFMGTTWSNCRIAGYLILNETTFDAAVIAGMLYSYESLETRDVRYLNGSGVLGGY